jgi:DMSO/TMAO reductase YedYZ heme-binding membrane subunit
VPGFRKYAATVAVFAAVLFFALIVALFGMISLLAAVPVIGDPHAGELVGPVAVAAAVLLLFGCLLGIALRVPKEHQRIAPLTALGIGVGAYLAYSFVGAIAYFITGDAVGALIFLGGLLTGPFAIVVGIVAFVIAMLFMLVLASRVADRGRPKWPWEKDDE